MASPEKMLEQFLAEEKAEEDKTIENVLKKADTDAKNKSLHVEVKYDKPVLQFFNIHNLVALVASDYLDENGEQRKYFREENGAGVSKRVVDMKIDDFLGMVEPIPEDDEKRHGKGKLKQFLLDLVSGHKFDWEVPTLAIKKTEDDNWKVCAHDGRHRAMLLKKIGYEEMPVCIYFKESDGKDGKWYIPYEDSDRWTDVVYVQNDTFANRSRTKFNFPITKENCFGYYSRYIDFHNELHGDCGECPCEASDCAIMEKVAKAEDEWIKGAPKECNEAKQAFEKDKEHLTKIPVPPIKMEVQNMQELLQKREEDAKKKDEKKD